MGEGMDSGYKAEVGEWVTAHLAVGDAPALVTRTNDDNTVSLTVFAVAQIIYRDNVAMYEFEDGDEDEDKVGYWSPNVE